jgi:Gametolysin peptidase M11
MPFRPFRRASRPFWVFFAVLLAVLPFAHATHAGAQALTSFQQGWQSGRPVVVSGVLTAIYADDFVNHRSSLVHMIRDEQTGKSFQVRFEAEAPSDLRSGARVTIAGRSLDSEIYVAACCDSATTSTTSSSAPTAPVTGDQRTLVMIANFRDTSVTCSASDINNVIFANPPSLSVNALYQESSLGQVSFSGNVIGPYTINANSTDSCNTTGWADAADLQAASLGVDVASYPRRVYVMPPSSCEAAGVATVGGVTGRAWIFTCGTQGVYAHELGHNLGMDHASTPTQEYGDSTDPMAIASWMLPGVNAPHRQELGWLPTGSQQLVAQDGLYDVAPLALDPIVAGGPQTLTIRNPDTGEYYYLSYRLPLGFDRYIDSWYHYRVSVHRYRGDGSSTRTFVLAGLADGETFVDSVNGISITHVSHDSARATARVQFTSPCISSAPSITLSPQAQSGTAGSSKSYLLSMTNSDAPACATSTFTFNDAVPAGWTGTLSTPSVTLSPGAAGQTTLSVTSAGGALAGTYAATLNTGDTVTAAHATSSALTYTVLDTVPPTPPQSLTSSVSQKLKQIKLAWGAASDNVGVVGYRVLRNGAVLATSTTTSWSDATSTAGLTYTYSVLAYDAAGNVSAPSNSVSATLSTGGGGGGKRP